jgi:hypothetical protein
MEASRTEPHSTSRKTYRITICARFCPPLDNQAQITAMTASELMLQFVTLCLANTLHVCRINDLKALLRGAIFAMIP